MTFKDLRAFLFVFFLPFYLYYCFLFVFALKTLPRLIRLFFQARILKQHIICSCKISVSMCKISVYFSASPHFRLVPPHFVCSCDGTNSSPPKTSAIWHSQPRHTFRKFLKEATVKEKVFAVYKTT